MATTITANGINFPDGSAGSPSIGGTDTNTGLFTGSDIVGFATGGSERLRIDASGNINIANDSGKLQLGTGADLQSWHNGTHSLIKNNTGRLYVLSDDVWFKDKDDGDLHAKFVHDGAVELYYDNSKKLETTTDGVQVTGEVVSGTLHCSGKLDLPDSSGATVGRVLLGDGDDLQLYHASNDNIINAQNGNLYIQRSGTTSLALDGNGDISIPDSKTLYFGNGADLQIWHNGTDSYITNQTNGGHLRITNVNSSKAIVFATSNTNRFQISDGGHLIPSANDTIDLGTSSYRWRNIYTNDLNLSNEGGSNDVDGTWGSYTIQEGAEDLFLVNRRNGKKYKFNLTEVS